MLKNRLLIPGWLLLLTFLCVPCLYAIKKDGPPIKNVSIIVPLNSNPRIIFGVEKLSKSLSDAGYAVKKLSPDKINVATKPMIIVATEGDDLMKKAASFFKIQLNKKTAKEGFTIYG